MSNKIPMKGGGWKEQLLADLETLTYSFDGREKMREIIAALQPEFKSEPESVYLSREDAEWYAEKAKEDLALWDGHPGISPILER